MCTAVCYRSNASYFGRNLDLERGYGERVVITPRNYVIPLRWEKPIRTHYAMIGMACVADDFPLYYEATNEKGLSMAGLHFPENAVYHPRAEGNDQNNITPFELIPWVLAQCSSIHEVRALLGKTNLVNTPFNRQLPLTPLHWMISDSSASIAAEPMEEGLNLCSNPFEVLTNTPPFAFHQTNVSHYMGLNTGPAASQFREGIPVNNYSLGLGALGLPGDFSSASRFIRALFVKENAVREQNEAADVNQFFHILQSAAMPKGCVRADRGYAYTRYSSCCNADRGIYYYTTYHQPAIRAISMHDVDLQQSHLYALDPIEGS